VEDVDLGVCAGRWYDGDPGRVAVVLPGARYLPFAPLLWFAREVVASRGWSVLEVWDEYLDRSRDPSRWVAERAEAALARVGDARCLLVTKSISSHAARIAADRGLAGIWLTPLIALDDDIASAFARLQAPALLVGGTADESWDGALARGFRHDVLEIDGANHSLQLDRDPRASLDSLCTVVERMDAFVTARDEAK